MERPREEEGDVQDSGEDVGVTPAPGMGGFKPGRGFKQGQ